MPIPLLIFVLLTVLCYGLFPHEHPHPYSKRGLGRELDRKDNSGGDGQVEGLFKGCDCRIYGTPRRMRCICRSEPNEYQEDTLKQQTPCKCLRYNENEQDDVFCKCQGDEYPIVPSESQTETATFFEL